MSQQPELTVDEQKVNNLWEAHLRTEFNAHSADDAIATMVANPRVNQIPAALPSLIRGASFCTVK